MEMGGQIKTLLGALPVVPNCSIVSHNPSTFDDDSGFSVAGSCSSSRASSPLAWLKPGKCVAIDCEMVGTGPGGRIGEVARCSIVNYRGDVVYDKYINPELPIKNYRTRWSGITKQNLKNAIPFKTAQKEILKILKDKRVVGHALHNDFKALKYFHPSSQTRDTSKIPLLKEIAGLPSNNGASLKTLAFNLLGKRIQVGSNGHCSVEDAQACLELYKLVEDQWEETLRCCSEISTSTSPETSEVSDNEHYMDDQYWPADLNDDSK
ncbi:apoptosis-enhancing nuclease [Xenopus laevis]|nr:apoptosis-enhancing nuclease [Xenopus laevis]AAH82831.1 LOC494737 protein [Xenopus laevis]